MYWIEFFISALVIIFAGARLTIFADRLSDHLNLGKAWIGIILLGLITSLPEAVACFVSVRSLNADDMAIGNLLGSNNFNPLLIVLMDMFYRKGSVTNAVHPTITHKLSAYYGLTLTLIVLFEIAFSGFPHLGPLSIGGVALVWVYMRGIYNLSIVSKGDQPEESATKQGNLSSIWMNLLICAVLVVMAAVRLTNAADQIALETGLGRTFVGSILLALVTSLPEMVVSFSALRLGSLDLAIGNIFGSNMSNMFIVFLCSLVNFEGPILYEVRSTHILTAFFSMMMVIIALYGIKKHDKKTFAGLGLDSWLMLILFLTGTTTLYLIR